MSDQDRLASILLIPLLLFVAASSALAWSGYEHDMRAAEARISMPSQVVSTPCAQIEYAEEATGPAVLANSWKDYDK